MKKWTFFVKCVCVCVEKLPVMWWSIWGKFIGSDRSFVFRVGYGLAGWFLCKRSLNYSREVSKRMPMQWYVHVPTPQLLFYCRHCVVFYLELLSKERFIYFTPSASPNWAIKATFNGVFQFSEWPRHCQVPHKLLGQQRPIQEIAFILGRESWAELL